MRYVSVVLGALVLLGACAERAPSAPGVSLTPFAATFDLKRVDTVTIPRAFGQFTLDSGLIRVALDETFVDVLYWRETATGQAVSDSLGGTYTQQTGAIVFAAPDFGVESYRGEYDAASGALRVAWGNNIFAYARRD